MSDTLRVLVADDEPMARRGLERLLAHHADLQVVAVCRDGTEATTRIQQFKPDVAFLDIAMPGLSDVDIGRSAASDERPALVFVSAFDRFASRAFDLEAVDFLVKPFNRERFETALRRARERVATTRRSHAGHGQELREAEGHLTIKAGARVISLPLSEVDWCEAQDNYVRIHTGPRRFLVRMTLRSLAERLDHRFGRIHRSAIVNLNKVRELKALPHGEYQVLLAGGVKLILSRTYRDAILDVIKAR